MLCRKARFPRKDSSDHFCSGFTPPEPVLTPEEHGPSTSACQCLVLLSSRGASANSAKFLAPCPAFFCAHDSHDSECTPVSFRRGITVCYHFVLLSSASSKPLAISTSYEGPSPVNIHEAAGSAERRPPTLSNTRFPVAGTGAQSDYPL